MITQKIGESRRLTPAEWTALVYDGKIEDLSSELPNEFLMIGQLMRAKIRFEGKVWIASAWFIDEAYVDLTEVIE